ncbi:MAG TPA: sn-glycerol-3-phosphate ABC transporter ATP-binding protein UgpC [Gaiellales bacterium]|jgi:multiple sugar transport system ATP-binding protein|nr:sn-glycerol-3-phosphate ABC transporter ATP-binding protein UgpC [Gaiellales bacterium]
MAEIVLERVEKVYPDGTKGVAGIDLVIPDGSLAVLVGPSGCGKTTLLRCVAGLEAITEGTVRIGDRVVNDVSPKDRDLAMVFQDYALYPQMSVYDNMAFSLKLRRMPKAQVRQRVEEVARTLGLSELLAKKPGQLSGGQRQRVAMGRAIVRSPRAFLMDEPLSNLDAKLRVQMRAEVRRTQRDLGVTTIYVTHDQTEAMTMGDMVAVMKKGFLQQWDEPHVLYNHPANLFVAGFIGSPAMNLVEATVESSNGRVSIAFAGVRLAVDPEAVAARPALARYHGRSVVVGIRPEGIEDASLAHGVPDDRRMRVVPDLCEALGSDVFVHFGIDAPPVLTEDIKELAASTGVEVLEGLEADAAEHRTVWVARVSPRSGAREGEPLELAVDTHQLHFFDPETGTAVAA